MNTLIGASREVLEHRAREHDKRCRPGVTALFVPCQCGSTVFIVCSACGEPVFAAARPDRPVCEHLAVSRG